MDRVIKNEEDYQEKLISLEKLLDNSPPPDSAEEERLELLSLLIRDYESKKYSFVFPDPIEDNKIQDGTTESRSKRSYSISWKS